MEEQPTRNVYPYEAEIDLRQYIDLLLSWWREIFVFALLCAVFAAVVSFLLPETYEAEARVAVAKEKSTLNLGSSLQTLTEEDLAVAGGRYFLDPVTRKNALANLVVNPAIAESVIVELGEDWLEEEELDPSVLVEKVEGEAAEDADLIIIRVTDGDPQKAAALASVWARAYVTYVNQLYSGTADNYTSIAAQMEKAEVTYDEAQANLEVFIQENRIKELNQVIAEKQSILERLQADKKSVLTTLFDLTWDQDILASHFDVILANQAFRGNGGFSKALRERLDELARDYNQKWQYESQINDIQAMRAQLTEGGDPATNALAIFLMKGEIFETSGELASGVLLQMEGPITQTAEAQTADLDALEAVLSARIETLDAAIAGAYTALAGEMDYGFETIAIDDETDFVNMTLDSLRTEIQTLQAELESQEAQRRELNSERDLAWESYQKLARREAELRVDREVPDSEVRFAAPAAVPQSPASPQKLMNTAIAGVAGGMIGVFMAFFLDYLGKKSLFSKAA